ncbi:MAG: Uma2 family endonuclease [Longimicrobiales bacterium]
MSTSRVPLITPAEYLEAERRAETKSEYLAGQVYAMTGASMRHNLIVANLVSSLHAQLKGRLCSVLPSDMRLHVPTGLYTYPDVTVVCGTPQLEDEHLDTLLNPTLLIEVLSDSTERYDRGRKAEHYRRIESLVEYLLIGQHEARIERYRRQGDREWVLSEAIGVDEQIELSSINCVLTLRDVYDRVLA